MSRGIRHGRVDTFIDRQTLGSEGESESLNLRYFDWLFTREVQASFSRCTDSPLEALSGSSLTEFIDYWGRRTTHQGLSAL